MTLAARFTAALGQTLDAGEAGALEAGLEAALAACRAAWPGVERDEGFIEHLAARRFAGRAVTVGPFEPGPQVTDLYLAWACGKGDRRALEHLETSVLTDVRRTVARLRLPDGVLVDEIVQRVRERALLPRASSGPAVLDYEGTGTLLNWLRTSALREVVTRSRQLAPAADFDDLLELPLPGDQPELALVRERFREPFRAAFGEAVAELGNEEKNLLRLSYLDRVPVDRIGALFGVHKSTISRRLEKARQQLFERTRALLAARLDLAGSELDSALRLVDASLEVSIPAALFESDDPPRNK